jgi:hypothetical protein
MITCDVRSCTTVEHFSACSHALLLPLLFNTVGYLWPSTTAGRQVWHADTVWSAWPWRQRTVVYTVFEVYETYNIRGACASTLYSSAVTTSRLMTYHNSMLVHQRYIVASLRWAFDDCVYFLHAVYCCLATQIEAVQAGPDTNCTNSSTSGSASDEHRSMRSRIIKPIAFLPVHAAKLA